jgi:NAD(P)-dependent dehydrogenase (short-subunit alcohol dehydrogenase family)
MFVDHTPWQMEHALWRFGLWLAALVLFHDIGHDRISRMNQIDLTGQTAVVTGGAQGLGLAIARRIVASGAKVSLWDLDAAELQKATADLGAAAKSVTIDITDFQAVIDATAETEAQSGPISILVNSAGIAGPNHTLDTYPVEDWKRVIDINLNGAFYVNRAVVPGMKARGYGRIVNIASIAGKEGNPNASAYSASKAAVIGMTKSLGKELAGYDIAVNAITPAAARTRIFDQMKQEHIDYMLSRIPRARFLEVDEAANMVAWLVSKENSFTTASVFDLSGGRATY